MDFIMIFKEYGISGLLIGVFLYSIYYLFKINERKDKEMIELNNEKNEKMIEIFNQTIIDKNNKFVEVTKEFNQTVKEIASNNDKHFSDINYKLDKIDSKLDNMKK